MTHHHDGPDLNELTPEDQSNAMNDRTTFADLLAAIGYHPDDLLTISLKQDGVFRFVTTTPAKQAAFDVQQYDGQVVDLWFGLNPVKRDLPDHSRGSASDVAAVRAFNVDMDVKPGAFVDRDELVLMLGIVEAAVAPTAWLWTGHGLCPIWAVSDTTDIATATAVGTRLRRAVESLASSTLNREVRLDNTSSVTRIVRVPGTTNWKDKDEPAPTSWEQPNGGGMTWTVARLQAVLDEMGVPAHQEDSSTDLGDEADFDTWQFAAESPCGYTPGMVRQWQAETPPARHPWLINRMVRLHCAVRHGCLTRNGYELALASVVERFEWLCRNTLDRREPDPGEVREAIRFGKQKAAGKTEEQVSRELGGHEHLDDLLSDTTGTSLGSSVTTETDSMDSTMVELFESSEELERIRDAALSRGRNPYGVLFCCLAYVIGMTPPTLVLPDVVGDFASLNIAVALTGASSKGKTTTRALAKRVLGVDVEVEPIGSGQGLVQAYLTVGPTKAAAKQFRDRVIFVADEIGALEAQGRKSSGSMLMPNLRSGVSGAVLDTPTRT